MTVKLKRVYVILVIVFCFTCSASWSMTIQLFDKESYHHILEENKNRPFLLVLWSIDCPPCHEELTLLGQYIKEHPELKLILISTDSYAHLDEVRQILSEKQLHEQELWVFSDAPSHQLRYSIDPNWYGELPRSYFFYQCHDRKSLSGKLNINEIESFTMNSKCQ